jgi:serine/threonine-protein kinase RsbT
MTLHVEMSEETPIESEEQIVLARKKVRVLAEKLEFDPFAIAAITTAASELSRNVWVHAGGGTAQVEHVVRGSQIGIRIEFRDEGPGIADLDLVLAGGHSTARSLGLGVSGSRRLVDEFSIETTVGRGTAVTVVKWKRAG